jgi:hypothetical protein
VTTISDGVASVVPTLIDGYEAARESRNVLHVALDGTEDVSLAAASPRAGSLRAVFGVKADAWMLLGMLGAPGVFTLASEVGEVDMSFTFEGDVSIALDDTRSAWIVEFGFRELSS